MMSFTEYDILLENKKRNRSSYKSEMSQLLRKIDTTKDPSDKMDVIGEMQLLIFQLLMYGIK